jgi:hypothetical protein
MPKVVPSQVVELIDRVFPNAASNPKFPVYSGHAAVLSAIVSLAEEIPEELLTVSGDDYTDLIHGMEALAHSVNRWNQRGGDDPPNWIKDKSPVAIVRDVLAKCPDQSPSPATSELAFISDDALRKDIRMDMSTANSALHNGEWKAATVLAGSVVEALLLWAIPRPPVQQRLATLASRPKNAPEHWNLTEFIDVAERLLLIKIATATQTRLAKDFRNLNHPGRAQRTAIACDRGSALTALAAVELVVRDLTP